MVENKLKTICPKKSASGIIGAGSQSVKRKSRLQHPEFF